MAVRLALSVCPNAVPAPAPSSSTTAASVRPFFTLTSSLGFGSIRARSVDDVRPAFRARSGPRAGLSGRYAAGFARLWRRRVLKPRRTRADNPTVRHGTAFALPFPGRAAHEGALV